MSLTPLLVAPAIMQAHALFAIAALLAGAAIFLSPKGTPRHRLCGRIGAAALLATALTSFGIHHNDFSLIHLLSVLTLHAVTRGIIAIRQGHIQRHSGYMRGAWIGLAVAAIFTLLPGRVMHAVIFGG